jgi:predicted NBD/HSP70 family sugar kinase
VDERLEQDQTVSQHKSAQNLIPEAFRKRVTAEVANASERQTLDVIRREPQITRAEIGRRIGLTGMSMTRIIDGLEQRGLVRATGRTGSGRGPKIGLELVSSAAYSIGVSIKADVIVLALVDFLGTKQAEFRYPLSDHTQKRDVDALAGMIRGFIDKNLSDRSRLFGVGIAITGFFIGNGLRVNPPAQLEDLALIDIDSALSQKLGLPVWLDNDGNAAAEAEAMLGVGRTIQNFAYLYFSTGFGGGIIQDGRLLRGRNGNAGEFAGAIPLEGYLHPNLDNLRLFQNQHGSNFTSVSQMLDQFDPNWPAIEEWLQKTAPALNIAVSAASAMLDPDAIVLGGQLPRALAERMIPMVAFSSGPRRGYIRPVPIVVPAEVTIEPALLGAAALPFRAHFFG